MQTPIGDLTFCTNIFPGESWEQHFETLKRSVPAIKKELAPHKAFGIGLRLSNKASLQLKEEETLKVFQQWLQENDCYVRIMNGFPYGNFHRTRVKDQVHTPDWLTTERLQYTLRLFHILETLLPEGAEGGVSTSPLSYKYWFGDKELIEEAIEISTHHIVEVVVQLYQIYQNTGKMLHLDLEPEPDGLIETADEFINWFLDKLIPLGTAALQNQFSLSVTEAEKIIRDHVRLCYDVCHFAVGFEEADKVLKKLDEAGILIGRWQLSSALRLKLPEHTSDKKAYFDEIKKFDEPVYLHQVIAKKNESSPDELLRYPDLAPALSDPQALEADEWRSHFHVPLFIDKYGLLDSTQEEVIKAIEIQKKNAVTLFMEVETYTWEVLPEDLKLPMDESIIREMKWVMHKIEND